MIEIENDIMTFFQASDVNSSSWISFFPTYLCERTRKPSRLILFTVIKSHKHSRLKIRNKRIEINIVKTGIEWIHTRCEQNYIESWNGLYILLNESYKKIIKLEKKNNVRALVNLEFESRVSNLVFWISYFQSRMSLLGFVNYS